jgi:ubiquinone/menaquinone biosynthesis C-methylase UbiE
MRPEHLTHYRCPQSGSPLRLVDPVIEAAHVVSGSLVSSEGRAYRIESGVIDFMASAELSPLEVRTQAEYDRVADGIYDTAVDWQFAAMREDEDAVRESMVDMLGLTPGARVLEIGCGTGRDSFRIARRLDRTGYLHMQDLSSGMVHACVRTMNRVRGEHRVACDVDYSVSSGAALPFTDGVFDAVFHFGGFNQFGDLKASAAEMARVARTRGRIVVGDEAVAPWLKGTEFDAIVTTNNALFKAEVPLDALPEGARDVVVRWIIGNCFYVIGFTKGDGPPPLDLDLLHQGWRGGTMRTRYFGVLEGVTPETKALVRDAAARAGLSVHEWLDRIVRAAATPPPA